MTDSPNDERGILEDIEEVDTGDIAEPVVDDLTYDLLQALTSKLEALDAYEEYANDDPTGLFESLMEDERRHARLILDALRERLAAS
jgi:rubrerythrin